MLARLLAKKQTLRGRFPLTQGTGSTVAIWVWQFCWDIFWQKDTFSKNSNTIRVKNTQLTQIAIVSLRPKEGRTRESLWDSVKNVILFPWRWARMVQIESGLWKWLGERNL